MSRADLLRNLPEADEAYIAAFEAVYPSDEAGPRDDEAGRERKLAPHREDIAKTPSVRAACSTSPRGESTRVTPRRSG